MLLKFNAAPFPRSKNNETPWDLAEKYGRRDCVQFFGKSIVGIIIIIVIIIIIIIIHVIIIKQ